MKIQIRRGVFETNSSNEHSLTVVNKESWDEWKEGKCLARVSDIKNCDYTNGNFDSYLYVFDFTFDFDMAKMENEEILQGYIDTHKERLEEWKRKCLEHEKKIKVKLTPEELEALSNDEYYKYEDDLYEDSLYEFDEKEYNEEMNEYNLLTLDDCKKPESPVSIIWNGMWMTYEEFMNEFKLDCYSTFYHEIPGSDMIIFGKYFHS